MIVNGPYHTKEVYYSEWCKNCKYRDLDETHDPCNECLTQGWNMDSHRPINYVLSITNFYDSKKKERKESE